MKREIIVLKSVIGTILRPWKYYPMVEELLKEQLSYTPSKRQIRKVYIDFVLFRIKWWGSIEDFFKSQMWRKSDFVREESLSRYVRMPWRDQLQAKELWHIFQDKRDFYKEYNDYLNRKWMIVGQDTDWTEFVSFLESCAFQVFAKVPVSMGGKDVDLLRLDTLEKQKKFYDFCRVRGGGKRKDYRRKANPV